MSQKLTKLERRLRVAGVLVILGLVVELVTLHWSHPTAFMFFLLAGATLMGAGIVIYLLTLLGAGRTPAAGEREISS
jgi:uncharacterized membrane protein YczE